MVQVVRCGLGDPADCGAPNAGMSHPGLRRDSSSATSGRVRTTAETATVTNASDFMTIALTAHHPQNYRASLARMNTL